MNHIIEGFNHRRITEFLEMLEQRIALALFGPISPSWYKYSFIPVGVNLQRSPILLFPYRI